MYERRLADKLNALDWKLSYIMDEEDLHFIHAHTTTHRENNNTAASEAGKTVHSHKETI